MTSDHWKMRTTHRDPNVLSCLSGTHTIPGERGNDNALSHLQVVHSDSGMGVGNGTNQYLALFPDW